MNANELRQMLTAAVAGLDPEDVAERIAWCRANGQHGVRMHTSDQDDLLDFRWGGRTLAMVHRDVLSEDEDGVVVAEFVASEVPDVVPDDWADS